MAVEIHELPIQALADQAAALIQENYLATVQHLGVSGLNFNRDLYLALESQGILLSLAAFFEGKILGYSVNMILPHPHFTQMKICRNDAFFVTADWRGTRTPLRLLAQTEQAAAQRGAEQMSWSAKVGSPFITWLPRVGYRHEESLFMKPLQTE